MPSQKDTVLGRLAVERGYLTQEQVNEALGIQSKMHDQLGMDQPLEQVLLGKHWLSLDQVHELRNAAAVETGEARLVAGYEVVSKLGQGGMGAVYKARRVGTSEYVALKVLPPSLADEHMIARFTRESEIVKKLHHRNIVDCIEFGFDKRRKCYFCALELVEGEDLRGRITRLGKLAEDEAISITSQIAMALQHAFYNSLVHRDVKPENIMVTADGTAKLLDLGLARPANQEATRMTESGMFVGSPYYASPEQALGQKEVDTRSDIYSLGATLYHMVTGKPPFDGTTALAILQKHLTEHLPWPADVNPELSDGLCLIIARMMAKDPDDRHQTPNDLNADFDLLMEGKEPEIAEAVLERSSLALPVVQRKRRRRLPGERDRQRRKASEREKREARAARKRRESARVHRKAPEPHEGPTAGRAVPKELSAWASRATQALRVRWKALPKEAKIAVLVAAGALVVLVLALLLLGGREPSRPGLTGTGARSAAGSVSPPPLNITPGLKGWISMWEVAGPYTAKGKGGKELFDVVFPPEEPGAPGVEWQVWEGSGARPWHVNFQNLKDMKGGNRVAYLRGNIASSRERNVTLEIGSDDGVKVWLGGEVVHANNTSRGLRAGHDKVKVTLKKGSNTLLLKITQGSADWGACVALVEAERAAAVPPPPRPARGTAALALREADEYEVAHPEDVQGIAARYQKVVDDFPGTRQAGEAKVNLIRLRPAAKLPPVTRGPPPDVAEFGGHRYKLYPQKTTWHEAKRICEEQGGHLVTITSKEENDFVTGLATKGGADVWIGFTDEREEGKWEWVTGEEATFKAWAQGNPSGLNPGTKSVENWGNLLAYKGYGWNDAAEASRIPFLCEWEAGAMTRAPASPVSAAVERTYRPPEKWRGTKVGAAHGNPFVADGKPLWRFDQVWPDDPMIPVNYRQMVWRELLGRHRWAALEHHYGGQPSAHVDGSVVYLIARTDWPDHPGKKLAALTFIAPGSATYRLEGSVTPAIFAGGRPLGLSVLRIDRRHGRLAEVAALPLRNGVSRQLESLSVPLEAGEELSFVPGFPGQGRAGASFRIEELRLIATPAGKGASRAAVSVSVPASSAKPPRAIDITRGLVAHWKFDETTGSRAADSSGKGNHGGIVGARWAKGKIGAALEFDGNDAVTTGLGGFNSDFTWAAWIRTKAPSGAIIGNAETKWSSGGKSFYVAGGKPKVDVAYVSFVQGAVVVNDNAWHHVALTAEFETAKTSDTVKVYVDGKAVVAKSNWNINKPEKNHRLRIGDVPGQGGYFRGLIDEVRVYRRALSAAEVRLLARVEGPLAKEPAAVEPEPVSGSTVSVLSQFDSLIEKGDYEGAKRLAERTARDPARAAEAGFLRAAARAAGEIESRRLAMRRAVEALGGRKITLLTSTKGKYPGTVEKVSDGEITLLVDVTGPGMGSAQTRTTVKWAELTTGQEDKLALKGDWKAAGADAYVGLACLALSRGQAAAATNALDRAGYHPLAARLRVRIEALKGLATSDYAAKQKPAVTTPQLGPRPEGSILREVWDTPPVGDEWLVLTTARPRAPDKSDYLTGFYSPTRGDRYNLRFRGYIHPPVTGDYQFYICCDDDAELWLSTDNDPANIRNVGKRSSNTGSNYVVAGAPVALVAGRRYYVEAVLREGTGGDYFGIGWGRPDAVQDQPIPGKYLSPRYDTPQPPKIGSAAPEVAYADTPYRYTIKVTGDPPLRITVTGLPAWLEFDGRDTIHGTPSKGRIGVITTTIAVTATNDLRSDTQKFRLKVRKSIPAFMRGLVGWWKFDEGRGTLARDSSGRNHHGTVKGPKRTTGKIGAALAFDGRDDHVKAAGYQGVLGTDPRTAAAWIKTKDGDAAIVFWGSPALGGKWALRVQSSNGTKGATRAEVNGGYVVGSTVVTDGRWHHVAATWSNDGTPDVTDTLLYVDGTLETTSATAARPISTTGGDDVTIGIKHKPPSPFAGLIDDVRVYDRALSAEEISALAAAK